MKNKLLRTLAAVLSVTTIASTSFPSLAYELDENGNSVEEVEYQNDKDEDFENSTNVFAELKSEYKVTIPKVIVLSGANKSGKYIVSVSGDIAGYETVDVVPEDDFLLYSSGKDSQMATVNQDKISWTYANFDTDANGIVEANGITAGAWQGIFYFNLSLNKVAGDIVLMDDYNITTSKRVLSIGETAVIKAVNSNGSKIQDLKFVSENETICTVNNTGIVTAASCGGDIVYVYDGDTLIGSISFEVNHNYELVVSEDATCTSDSLEAYKCKKCGKTYVTHNTKAFGHTYDSASDVVKEATCTEGGYTTHTCTTCGKTYTDNYVSALGHNFVDGVCTRCGISDVSTLASGLYSVNSDGTYTLKYTWAQLLSKGYIEVSNGVLNPNGASKNTQYTSVLSGLLVIDSSVTKIINHSGVDLNNITDLFIPNSVDIITLGYEDFRNVANIYIEDNSKYIIKNGALYSNDYSTLYMAPRKTSGTFVIDENCKEVHNFAFFNSMYSEIVLPDGLEVINSGAFYQSYNITSIYIPASVTTIGSEITSNTEKLTSIVVNSNNKNYTVYDNCLYSSDMKTLYAVMTSRPGSFTIPSTVEILIWGAMNWCSKLTSITIPNSVIIIEKYAFNKCTSLTSITFEDPNNWYKTENSNYTSGTQTDVTNASANATNLKSTYNKYYWYKK